MKKRTFIRGQALIGSVLLTASILSGCTRQDADDFDPTKNVGRRLYGPPTVDETPLPEESFDPEDNIPAPVYGPAPDDGPAYDPALNEPECVYGPPSMFGLEDDEEPAYEEEETPAPEEDTQG